MPHFGLMDEDALGPVEGPLQRAKLHIRGGRRRLRQGKISAGIVTLYDALISAMRWYLASPEHRRKLDVREADDPTDDKNLFEILRRSGVAGKFDFESFDKLVETALNEEMPGFDYGGLWQNIEDFMTGLGVMPFDESDLPPEDPSTF